MHKREPASSAKTTYNRARMGQVTTLMIVATLTLAASLAHAQEDSDPYDYTIDNDPTQKIYPHANDACLAAYQFNASFLLDWFSDPSFAVAEILPYESPTLDPPQSDPPTYIVYDCHTSFHLIWNGFTLEEEPLLDYITGTLKEISCPDGKVENNFTAKCEDPYEDQARKESGNPADVPLGGVVTCAGNPVSIASGNKFQEEEDFRSSDGELQFKRYYNGFGGTWTHSYGMKLDTSGRTLLLTFDDGRSSIFTAIDDVAIGEPTEQGRLEQVSGLWVYTAPDDTKYTFNGSGDLKRKQLPDGRTQRIAYLFQPSGKVRVTVTDSGGRTLEYVTSAYQGPLETLKAGGVTINYTLDENLVITKAKKTWGSYSTTRYYDYEDTRHPTLLTGIIDERGIRFATWHYDSQGRAISSEHANGAEKVSLDYQTDGSVVVTNALGHHVTYRYRVIQGIKRVTSIEGEPAAGCPASNSTYTYTARGQVETKTDAVGTVTAYEYDTQGRETKRIEAKGTPQERTIATTWDPTRFQPLTITTPDRVTTYTYDVQGHLLSTSAHAIKE